MNLDDSIIPRPTPETGHDIGGAFVEVKPQPPAELTSEQLYGVPTPNIDSLNAIDAILQEPELQGPAPTASEKAEAIRELVSDPGVQEAVEKLFSAPAPLPFPRVHPFGSRVLVKPDDAPENYDAAGLIQRTDQARERPQEGTIVRIGLALKPIDETKLQHVRIGQRVMYGMYSGSDVYVDDVGYIMLDVEDLLGEVEGEGPASIRKTWEKPAEPSRIIPVERDRRIIIP